MGSPGSPTSGTPAARDLVRDGTGILGVGLVLFSLPAIAAPRLFSRAAGLPMTDEASAEVAIRSVAVRDVAMGAALAAVAWRGRRPLSPWLLARVFCELGDAAAIAIAVARGSGGARLGGLGIVALVAAGCELALIWLARQDEAARAPAGDAVV